MRFELKLAIGFMLTLGIFLALGVYTYLSSREQIESSQWVTNTNEVLYSSQRLLTIVLEAETGSRGFVLTGDSNFLEPYNHATDSLRKRADDLLKLTTDNVEQHEKIKILVAAIERKIEHGGKLILARENSLSSATEMATSLKGKKLMDEIRLLIDNFQATEKQILLARTLRAEQQIQDFNNLLLSTFILLIVLLGLMYGMIFINLKARKNAELELKNAADEIQDLYDNAPCGYFSVNSSITVSNSNQTLLGWLGYSLEEIVGKFKYEDFLSPESKAMFLKSFEEDFARYKESGSVHDLEFDFKRKDGSLFPVIVSSVAVFGENGEFIKSRSTVMNNTERKKVENKIKLLNHELEAFTYSVSHDLRAPLRSVVGYTNIIKEDYSTILDKEGHRVINVIMNNALRMGQLIDDLLDFSRMGRKELSKSNLNMIEIVQNVWRELVSQENGRKLELNIAPLKMSTGDVSMIRQVWINLISNALKYSQKNPITKIEIGSFEENDQTCYYISDNGAGFDMQYVDKLFGVFQRLHKMSEFEGTGVGLALVKRIIQRHEGTVRAEGKLNEGAKFYFTLPHIS
ncbi:MAG: CHASE3 domain-containing protein [Bacteroidia bacterium]|nr:CHASE3 domain-containing protein [Bacteroidia bacterium]